MVGLNVQEPETTCDDPNCPFHGTLPVRGQVLEGVVVSNKAERTISVERSYYKFIRKYERYEKRNIKIASMGRCDFYIFLFRFLCYNGVKQTASERGKRTYEKDHTYFGFAECFAHGICYGGL